MDKQTPAESFIDHFLICNFQQQFTLIDFKFMKQCEIISEISDFFLKNQKIEKLPSIVLKEIKEVCTQFCNSH